MKRQLRSFIRRCLFALLVVAVWLAIVKIFAVPDYILPAPQVVASTFAEDFQLLSFHFLKTFKEWVLGLVLSIAIALAMSLAAFHNDTVSRHIRRYLVVSQAVPYLTIAPLLLLWLGLGSAPKLVLIILTCTFPIAQLTVSGLTNARSEYTMLATLLRFSRGRALTKLYAPAALPDFFEGVKISVTYAFVSTVLAELIGSEAGLGVYLSRAQSAYRTDRVLAVVFVIVFFSLLCTSLVSKISQRLVFWKGERHA